MSARNDEHDARVVAIDDAAPDTRILRVELDNKKRLPFRAGQYVHLCAKGQEPRAFSIASAPQDPFLEFHIRNTGRGFSAFAFESLAPGSALTVSDAHGDHVLREGSGRPLLMLAGGIGIAPMKAMIETHLGARGGAPVALYWGVRAAGQLYLDPLFRALAHKHPHFSYIPILSEEAGNSRFRHGLIGDALREDFDSLHGFSVYMAGPKAMIDATLPVLEEKNAEKEYIFSDAFSL